MAKLPVLKFEVPGTVNAPAWVMAPPAATLSAPVPSSVVVGRTTAPPALIVRFTLLAGASEPPLLSVTAPPVIKLMVLAAVVTPVNPRAPAVATSMPPVSVPTPMVSPPLVVIRFNSAPVRPSLPAASLPPSRICVPAELGFRVTSPEPVLMPAVMAMLSPMSVTGLL